MSKVTLYLVYKEDFNGYGCEGHYIIDEIFLSEYEARKYKLLTMRKLNKWDRMDWDHDIVKVEVKK